MPPKTFAEILEDSQKSEAGRTAFSLSLRILEGDSKGEYEKVVRFIRLSRNDPSKDVWGLGDEIAMQMIEVARDSIPEFMNEMYLELVEKKNKYETSFNYYKKLLIDIQEKEKDAMENWTKEYNKASHSDDFDRASVRVQGIRKIRDNLETMALEDGGFIVLKDRQHPMDTLAFIKFDSVKFAFFYGRNDKFEEVINIIHQLGIDKDCKLKLNTSYAMPHECIADWLDGMSFKRMELVAGLAGGGVQRQTQKRAQAVKCLEAFKKKSSLVQNDKVVAIPQVAVLSKKVQDFKDVIEGQGGVCAFQTLLGASSMDDLSEIGKEISKEHSTAHITETKLKKATPAFFGSSLKDLMQIRESIDAIVGACENSILFAFHNAGTNGTFNLGDLDKLVSIQKSFFEGQGYMP